MSRRLLLVFLCLATAVAQKLPRGRGGPADRIAPPVPLIQCGQPQYTEEARTAHLAGPVTMSLIVDDEGMPTDIHVVNPLGLGLDESAVRCMSQSRYSPAQKEGKPVPYKINVSLWFENRWDSDWHLGAAMFRTPPGTVRPVLTKAQFPPSSAVHRNATVSLSLTIDRSGKPRDLHCAGPEESKLEKEAIGIVAGWCFRPAIRNSQPVEVPASLTLVRGSGPGAVAKR